MSQSANVRSIQAIRDFKVALATFAEDGRNALSSTEMEIRRVRNWLIRDQVSLLAGRRSSAATSRSRSPGPTCTAAGSRSRGARPSPTPTRRRP